MKLSEQHIFKGYWWLPNNPEKKVAGVLTYTPAEHILLELIGAFDSDEESLDLDIYRPSSKQRVLDFSLFVNSRKKSILSMRLTCICFFVFSLNTSI